MTHDEVCEGALLLVRPACLPSSTFSPLWRCRCRPARLPVFNSNLNACSPASCQQQHDCLPARLAVCLVLVSNTLPTRLLQASCYVPSAIRPSIILSHWGRKGDANHTSGSG